MGYEAIAGAVLGMMQQGMNEQGARKGMELGLQNQRQLASDQSRQQLDMWKKTGPVGMMEQYTKAGLNPGLIYGMSGGGAGQTGSGTPSASSANVQAAQAADMALTVAQAKNVEADTELKKTQTNKLGGVDTANVESGTALNKSKTVGQDIANQIANATVDEQIKIIGHQADIAQYKADQEYDNQQITRATRNLKIDTSKQELLNLGIQAAAAKAGIKYTQEQTAAIETTLKQRWQEIKIAAQNANTQEGRLELEKKIKDISDSTKLTVETITRLIYAIF